MKTINNIILVLVLAISGIVSANSIEKTTPVKDTLSTEIYQLLHNNNLNIIGDDLVGIVEFTINKSNEIVVLSIETKNQLLEGFVKSRLNYKKVKSIKNRVVGNYKIKVVITAKIK